MTPWTPSPKPCLEYETLNGEQVRDLIELGYMRNPPKTGLPAPHPLPPPPKVPAKESEGVVIAPDYPRG